MVRELFLKKLKLELFEKDIESAARTGKKQLDEAGNAKPRDIVVKLANFKDKETLLMNANRLDGLPYSVVDDTELHAEIQVKTVVLHQNEDLNFQVALFED